MKVFGVANMSAKHPNQSACRRQSFFFGVIVGFVFIGVFFIGVRGAGGGRVAFDRDKPVKIPVKWGYDAANVYGSNPLTWGYVFVVGGNMKTPSGDRAVCPGGAGGGRVHFIGKTSQNPSENQGGSF
jgi:hypothetical protein